MKTDNTYTVQQASDLSDLPKTMVNYLCRHELLEPSEGHKPGRGRARQYTFGDVVILRALSKLLKAGISVARLKAALRSIRKYHSEITPNTLPGKYIVTDGEQVFLRKENESLEILDKNGQMTFAFVLELQSLRNEVNTILEKAS